MRHLLGLGLGLGGVRVLGATYDPDASAWFAAMQAAGVTLTDSVKSAYNTFFLELKAPGNYAAFTNGMFLSYVGFNQLAGCFIPLASRGGALPTNVGFVQGAHNSTGLQGNGSAYINCVIGMLASQQNNHVAGTHGNIGTVAFGGHVSNRTSIVTGAIEIHRNDVARVSFRSSSSNASISNSNNGLIYIDRKAASGYTYHNTGSSPVLITQSSEAPITSRFLFFSLDGGFISDRKAQLGFWGDALPDPAAFNAACTKLIAAVA